MVSRIIVLQRFGRVLTSLPGLARWCFFSYSAWAFSNPSYTSFDPPHTHAPHTHWPTPLLPPSPPPLAQLHALPFNTSTHRDPHHPHYHHHHTTCHPYHTLTLLADLHPRSTHPHQDTPTRTPTSYLKTPKLGFHHKFESYHVSLSSVGIFLPPSKKVKFSRNNVIFTFRCVIIASLVGFCFYRRSDKPTLFLFHLFFCRWVASFKVKTENSHMKMKLGYDPIITDMSIFNTWPQVSQVNISPPKCVLRGNRSVVEVSFVSTKEQFGECTPFFTYFSMSSSCVAVCQSF